MEDAHLDSSASPSLFDQDAIPPSAAAPRRTTVEDVPEEDSHLAPEARYLQTFPDGAHAGFSFGESPTQFEKVRDDQILKGDAVYGPFADNEEWELAKWLIKNIGHTQTEHFLKLPIIQRRVQPGYRNKDTLLRSVDSLPNGADWQCELVELLGDITDLDGKAMKETVEFWFRDPLECIRELIGNPTFRDAMKYAPERHFVDKNGKTRVISEMSTADWWWNLQVSKMVTSNDKKKLT
ncbi:uncharacterized protein B0H18DRAFT_875767 [Fomitopsis serialis]|uniref:uncharacterized protein n=1 Tax=Fomitopsis serialis TaxID=139415 RepID=UPI00200859B2|nr:uncharacterized protein B0H18DRAFT_875767 [Neoantrodia serialis]KAH9927362.1 hypothetical protein B0H18DRAFT_875767 [Neoantrodia serialis]